LGMKPDPKKPPLGGKKMLIARVLLVATAHGLS
jgi:hypothetical protein